MPGWDTDLAAFVDYGRTIAYLDSASYVQGSAATDTDVRAGTSVAVTVRLNNPKAIALTYTISADSALVSGTIAAPASTAGADNGITTTTFTFTPTTAAEHGDITFKLGISTPTINRTFDPATFKVRCDSPPGPVTNLTAGIRADRKACIGFTLPEDYADADITKAEITYTSSTAGTSKTVTEDVSPTGTGLTTVPSPSPLSSSAGKYVRYYLPDDVIAGNQYTFTVTPIDASGKKSESAPATASLAGDELYLGYDANGGTGAVAATIGYNGTTTTTIAAGTILSRDGYGFTGWNTKADGSGTAYAPGAGYTFGTSSLMLYAQWMKLSTVSVVVTTPGYQGVTVTQNGTTVTTITMDKDGTLNLSMPLPAGATNYQWYLNSTPEVTTATWSFMPSSCSPAITAGTYTITGTASYGGVLYSSALVVTVTNDYMITILPFNPEVTFTESTYTDSVENTPFKDTLTRGYKMGKTEVSYQLWSTVHEWAAANGYTFNNPGADGWNLVTNQAVGDPAHPVTTIGFDDALVWCNAYSEMTGFTPCYYTSPSVHTNATILRAAADVNPSYTKAYVEWGANGYRLPTEGEWQYAASCGMYYGYKYVSGAAAPYDGTTATWANWANAGTNVTAACGSKEPNIWGLNDMSGNVWEWCYDRNDAVPSGDQINYVCDTGDTNRIVRGGSCSVDETASETTVGYRAYSGYNHPAYNTGFRLARTITQ